MREWRSSRKSLLASATVDVCWLEIATRRYRRPTSAPPSFRAAADVLVDRTSIFLPTSSGSGSQRHASTLALLSHRQRSSSSSPLDAALRLRRIEAPRTLTLTLTLPARARRWLPQVKVARRSAPSMTVAAAAVAHDRSYSVVYLRRSAEAAWWLGPLLPGIASMI